MFLFQIAKPVQVFILILTMTCGAWAEIGGTPSSLATECAGFKGNFKVISNDQQQCATHGYTLTYSIRSGVIDKITWEGRQSPPLNILLGKLHSEFVEAVQKTPRHPGIRRGATHETAHVSVLRHGRPAWQTGAVILKTAAN
jgi:hypothetical protein